PLSPPTTPPRPSPPACRPYCVPDPPPPPPCPTRRSSDLSGRHLPAAAGRRPDAPVPVVGSYLECMPNDAPTRGTRSGAPLAALRSEEHTSELQSRENIACRPPPEPQTWPSPRG